MRAIIKQVDDNSEYWIPEGCHILELSNSPDDPNLSIARARVEPGVTTQWHRLQNTEERYFILSGKGMVEIDDQSAQRVCSGDTVLIPAMCRQRISNPGPDDLIFLALCTPRFDHTVYEALPPT
ncbi:MAG: mannose-6-phosphate isomerase-like protein (cupin superfamily) [Parasphingorhabdus sp.]|jgi:mannose-6-phosphate isomerase-like protein (cupin superfamily)